MLLLFDHTLHVWRHERLHRCRRCSLLHVLSPRTKGTQPSQSCNRRTLPNLSSGSELLKITDCLLLQWVQSGKSLARVRPILRCLILLLGLLRDILEIRFDVRRGFSGFYSR